MFGFATEEYSFHESVGVGSLSVALEGDLGDLNLTLFVDTEDDNVNATAKGNTPLQHSLLLCYHIVVIVSVTTCSHGLDFFPSLQLELTTHF